MHLIANICQNAEIRCKRCSTSNGLLFLLFLGDRSQKALSSSDEEGMPLALQLLHCVVVSMVCVLSDFAGLSDLRSSESDQIERAC